MYLTAQRVRATRGQEGINVLLYRHGNDAAVNWENPDFEELTMNDPGNLVARSTQIRPGGTTFSGSSMCSRRTPLARRI